MLSNAEREIQLELIMDARGLSYQLGKYPEIREFIALVEQLEPGRTWNGLHYFASADFSHTQPIGAIPFSQTNRRGYAHFRRRRVARLTTRAFGFTG
jgi:hypothetical protein